MNQKLSDWASIAEIVSGIAVVITLVFLVLGIRENTEVMRATSFASSIDTLNEFTASVVTDSELRQLWLAHNSRDGATFTDDE